MQSRGLQLLADTIPSAWDNLWEGPASPSDYIRAVVSRAVAIEAWWSKSQAGNLLNSGAAVAGSHLAQITWLHRVTG